MATRVTAALFVALAMTGAPQQPDPAQVLIQMRHKVGQGISRIPRYLCTETVERRTLQLTSRGNRTLPCPDLLTALSEHRKHLQLLSADRLRLDVAVIDKHEIYSWVGEGRFGDQSLSEIVKVGLTANGSFRSFLEAIFVADGATFSYLGESEVRGRPVKTYEFHVPLEHSSYDVGNAFLERRVPYSGSFAVDAGTLDLLTLEIHADKLPPELNFCQVSNAMDYTQLRMNNLDFLLPSEATTVVINSNGYQSVNRTVFSSCHQFLGESKLVFGDAPAPAAVVKPKPVEIPAGQTLVIATAHEIDPATGAAGDVIQGSLVKSVEIPGLNVTIPQGTAVHGRICQLVMNYGDMAGLQFGVKWETMDLAGAKQTLRLSLESAVRGTGKTSEIDVMPPKVELGMAADETIGYLLFPYVRKNYQIPAGFESRWVSLAK